MKSFVIFLLLLVMTASFMPLALAEPTATADDPAIESVESIPDAISKTPAENWNVVLVISNAKSNNLQGEAILPKIQTAAALIANALQGTGATLTIEDIQTDVAPINVDISGSDAAQQAYMAVAKIEHSSADNESSGLFNTLNMLADNAAQQGGNYLVAVLTDAKVSGGDKLIGKMTARDKLKTDHFAMQFYAIDADEGYDASYIDKLYEGAYNSNELVSLTTEDGDVALTLANDVLEALGDKTYSAYTLKESSAFADRLLINPCTVGNTTYAQGVKTPTLTISPIEDIKPGESNPVIEVSVTLDGVAIDLPISYAINNNALEDNTIPADMIMECGQYSVTVSYSLPDIDLSGSAESTFCVLAAPQYIGETAFVVQNTADAVNDYRIEGIAFDDPNEQGIANVSAEAENFEAEYADGVLTLSGKLDATEQTVKVTLTASNVAGIETQQTISVELTDEVGLIEATPLEIEGLDGEYTQGDEVRATVKLKTSTYIELSKTVSEDWLEHLKVYASLNGESPVALEGNTDDGWSFSGKAVGGENTLKAWLSVDNADLTIQPEQVGAQAVLTATMPTPTPNPVTPSPSPSPSPTPTPVPEPSIIDKTLALGMPKLGILSGGVLLMVVLIIIIVKKISAPMFRGSITIAFKLKDREFISKSIELSGWGKKKVNFGQLMMQSTLPPIGVLTDADISEHLAIVPMRKGIGIRNKTKNVNGDTSSTLDKGNQWSADLDGGKLTIRYEVK